MWRPRGRPAPQHQLNSSKPECETVLDNTSHATDPRPICDKLGAGEGLVQPGYDSRIADSFASRLERAVRRFSREHLTIGIILLVLGVFAFQISPWLAWFTVGNGLLLLTWHTRMQGTYRGLLYFITLLPVLHWFNSINEFLFHEDAVTGMMLSRDTASPLELVYGLIFAGVAIGGLIFVIRRKPHGGGVQ